MNKEIKEILDKLNKIVPYANVPKELAYMTTNITPQECKILLDYITNLQEELEESIDKILDLEDTIVDKNKCIVVLRDSISKLQKENQQLKADYGSKSQVERDLLEQRIDKAIESLTKNKFYIDLDEVLNILKGEEK